MRVPGKKRASAVARWTRSRFGGRALVLGYHRVADEASDPFGMCVRPELFEHHLEAIRRYARPVRLRELVAAPENGEPPSGAVAVTFDDGYADVLSAAKPVLERYEVPATVFVATGFIGGRFWWDEFAAHDAPVSRKEYRRLRRLSGAELREAIDARLASRTDRGGTASRSKVGEVPRALREDEIGRLVEGGLIEIGAHSVSHPLLTGLPVERQLEEIQGSRSTLERLTGQRAATFAYPYGDYDSGVVELVRQAGYECACTSRADVVRRASRAHELPRMWPSRRDSQDFNRWLQRWLGDLTQ